MKIIAKLKNYRKSPKKIVEAASLLKDSHVDEAIQQLSHLRKGFADDLAKLIKSAIANAENNFKLSKENLFISKIIVNGGPVLKRWRPRAYGRAAQILKRTSHITVELEERKKEEKKEKKEGSKNKSKLANNRSENDNKEQQQQLGKEKDKIVQDKNKTAQKNKSN